MSIVLVLIHVALSHIHVSINGDFENRNSKICTFTITVVLRQPESVTYCKMLDTGIHVRDCGKPLQPSSLEDLLVERASRETHSVEGAQVAFEVQHSQVV